MNFHSLYDHSESIRYLPKDRFDPIMLKFYKHALKNGQKVSVRSFNPTYGETEETIDRELLVYEDMLIQKSKNIHVKQKYMIKTNALDGEVIEIKPHMFELRTQYLSLKHGIITDEQARSKTFDIHECGIREDPFGDILRELGYTKKLREFKYMKDRKKAKHIAKEHK